MSLRTVRWLISILFTLFLFTMSMFLANSIFQSRMQKEWLFDFFQWRILFMPVILYLLIIAIIGGSMLFFILGYWQKRLLKPLATALHRVAGGDIEEQGMQVHLERYPYLKDPFYDLHTITQQLRTISIEIQRLTAQPLHLDGQTKEEILETERHRLARELHDSVSQELFAAMMMLSAMNEVAKKNDVPQTQQKQVAMITDIINKAQSEMRALLLHLRPINLEGKTLKKGIEQLLVELKTKVNIQITWQIQEVSVASNVEDQVFRIVQELLSNTLRHAKAKEVEVYLHQVDQLLLFRFIDDGIGFDVSEVKSGSYGLMNIRERVHSIGGTLKIISFKNQGTSVEIKIPIFTKGVEENDSGVVS